MRGIDDSEGSFFDVVCIAVMLFGFYLLLVYDICLVGSEIAETFKETSLWSACGFRFFQINFVDSIQQAGPNGADYNVRHINSSDKTYLCPGCLQDILPKTAHIVAWERNLFLRGRYCRSRTQALAFKLLET